MYSAAPFSGWKQYCIVASLWWRFTRWEITSMSTYTGKAATVSMSADRTKGMIPSTVSGFRWSRSVVGAAGFQTDADQPERARCRMKKLQRASFPTLKYKIAKNSTRNVENFCISGILFLTPAICKVSILFFFSFLFSTLYSVQIDAFASGRLPVFSRAF